VPRADMVLWMLTGALITLVVAMAYVVVID